MHDFQIISQLAPQLLESDIEAHLDSLDYTYTRNFPPRKIVEHLKIISKNKTLHVSFTQMGSLWEVLLVAKDYVGLFPVVTGCLNQFDINVINGHNYSYKKGFSPQIWTIDTFQVVAPANFNSSEIIDLITKMDNLARNKGMSEFRKYMYQNISLEKMPQALNAFDVDIHQEESYTDLRVRGQDTPAFLFFLSNTLTLMGCQILKFRVNTNGKEVDDRLFIVDRNQQPIKKDDDLKKLGVAVTLVKQFCHYLPSTNDQFSALNHFYAFLSNYLKSDSMEFGDDQSMELIAKVFGSGEFLWEEFSRIQAHNLVDLFRNQDDLKVKKTKSDYLREFSEIEGSSFEEKIIRINAKKDKELFRLDLMQLVYPSFTFQEFSKALCFVAEVCVQKIFSLCYDNCLQRYGDPQVHSEKAEYAIIALGKFGSKELGYASDLELLFLYNENGKTSGSNSVANQDFFDKVVFLFRKNFKAKTDGIFELDLRLRPYGVDGSLSNSFNSWKQYLLEKAHPIEIQSCTRLRIIQCSDDNFKNVLLNFVDEFVYKPIDKLAFLEMRAKQLQSHVKKDNNAKYSPGALADLEYTIQHYQLKYAKNIPELKHGTILDLLRVLLQNNLVSIGVFENLSKVYAFYRRLINALRLAKGNAKDLSLPNTNSPDMRFLLKRMGYVENQKDLFWQTWSDSLKSVGIFFDYFFHGKKEEYNPKGIALAISKGFDGDTELLGNAFNISNGDDLKDSFVQLYNSSLNSELLLGLIVESAPLISESANSQKLARFFVQYSREAEEYNGLLSELLYHPNMLRLILLLGDLSDFFANILIRHPRMVLKLLDTGELNQRKNKSHFDIEIKERLKSSIDEKFVLHRLVRYRNREYLRIILRDFHLGISQEYITAEISDLTGALFRGIYGLNGKKYPNTLTDQSVLAFGKWGAKELNYSSDIDITFVKSNTCNASLERENKSLLRLLSSYTPYGQLFRVDTTLRPYGQQGNLVATEDHYLNYYESEAHGWEMQIWLKAKSVAGDIRLGHKLIDAMKSKLLNKNFSWVYDSVKSLRIKVLERIKKAEEGDLEVKSSKWGIRTIEFWAQRENIRLDSLEELSGNTIHILKVLSERGILDPKQYAELYHAYTWLRRVEHILQLKEMQQLHSLPTSKEGRTHIAIHLGYLQKLKASPLEQFEIALKQVKTIVLEYHKTLFPDLL